MDLKDFSDQEEPEVTLIETLLKLFEKIRRIRIVQVVFGDMVFTGNSYTLRGDFVMVYSGIEKILIGKIPTGEIFSVTISEDILTLHMFSVV